MEDGEGAESVAGGVGESAAMFAWSSPATASAVPKPTSLSTGLETELIGAQRGAAIESCGATKATKTVLAS
ncbi:hypothetical protein ACFZDK_43995 [Streptomyces sp. NPDC007901]|uniref:hypothetical protein n=1 Tax=Streptomyces sp. NPDC007901 TaxID=3364785 RepID=UPI0036EB3A3C